VSDFLNMGGYAAYVWPSYGLTLVVIVLNIVWARRLLARSRERSAATAGDARRRDMTPRRKRMSLVFGIIAGVSVAGALALNAFRQNVTFFFDRRP